VDVYFENVGGAVFDAVLPLFNAGRRMTICGLIAHYGDAPDANAGAEEAKRAKDRGVTVSNLFVGDFVADHHDAFLADMGGWVARGEVKYREDIREGLETLPAAFAEMLKGGNFGKMLVRISDDPTL
jgi:NADPH-dependent curcumin reductase CurA